MANSLALPHEYALSNAFTRSTATSAEFRTKANEDFSVSSELRETEELKPSAMSTCSVQCFLILSGTLLLMYPWLVSSITKSVHPSISAVAVAKPLV